MLKLRKRRARRSARKKRLKASSSIQETSMAVVIAVLAISITLGILVMIMPNFLSAALAAGAPQAQVDAIEAGVGSFTNMMTSIYPLFGAVVIIAIALWIIVLLRSGA